MIRLIATDVDGTIAADGSCNINPEYYTVIQELRALGIQVAAASGRQKDSLLNLFAPVKEKIFYISNNGAGLGCWNRELFVQTLAPDLIHELMEETAKLPGCQTILSGVDNCFYSPGAEEWFIRYLREDYHFEALPWKEERSEEDLAGIVKVAIYHDPSTEHPALPLIGKMRGRLDGVVSGKEWVDFVALDVSKGNALAKLQESLSISPEETMVFGDQMNDIAMMQRAVHSFAVGGARREVKEIARHMTAPREEDGVLQVWKTLVANKGEYQE